MDLGMFTNSWVWANVHISRIIDSINTNHQQMHKKSFIINRNTLLHVSTLLGHLQGELFLLSLH
jgi:hypothetical protein